jgi:hypothetical protein
LLERRGRLLPFGLETTDAERAALEEWRETSAVRGRDVATETTCVGLVPVDEGWLVEAQDAAGMHEVRAANVVIATGGYVTPREHRSIDGPRPAGVFTADLVLEATARGLVPARHALIVGSGRVARRASALLETAGCTTEMLAAAAAVNAIRGGARLTGVLVGNVWRAADSLVLADELRPATFLLRGLGLVDNRPDRTAPADRDGRLPLPGLWAVGSCVAPDIEHASSLRDGLRIGDAIARETARRPVSAGA